MFHLSTSKPEVLLDPLVCKVVLSLVDRETSVLGYQIVVNHALAMMGQLHLCEGVYSCIVLCGKASEPLLLC